MKKLIAVLSVAVVVTMVACSEPTTKETKVEKEVITTTPTTAPAAPVPPSKDVKIKVDTAGMKVETKKVDVSVGK